MAANTKRYVDSRPYKWPYDGELCPENTALIAIDMQTDFCGKGGYVDAMGYDLANTRAPIEPIGMTFSAFRALGYHVLHTREGHRPSLADCPANKRWRSRQIGAGIGDPGPCGRVLVRGERGWDLIDELKPKEGEEVIDKPGKGSFVATDLDMVLRQKGIRNLVLSGITTDVCVSTTMREANDLGYECLLLSDCTGATDYGNYVATLKTTQTAMGAIGCVAAAADLLRAIGAEVPPALEAGLCVQSLGDGIYARMPRPPCGPLMPGSLVEVEVAPKRAAPVAQGGKTFVAADPYMWPYDGDLRPENTALFAIDFQKDMVSPEGYLAKMGGNIVACEMAAKVAGELLRAVRRKGLCVLHARQSHAPDLSDCPPRQVERTKLMNGVSVGESGPLGRYLIRGEGGCEFVPPMEPLEGEIVLDRPSYGAFSVTAVESVLRMHGIRNLVLVGVSADVAVHTTMRQANDRGFECLLVQDGVASMTPDTYFSALKQVKMQHGVFGAVSDSVSLLQSLAHMADTASEPSFKKARC